MSNEAETRRELEARHKSPVQREGTRPGIVFQPQVDIAEDAEGYVLTADLPGVSEDRVQVRVEEGRLRLEASLSVEASPAWTPLYREYRQGSFYREFALPDEIDPNRVEARMRDGVLSLRLPKSERAKPRRIEVRTG